jgi:hypothetical protein
VLEKEEEKKGKEEGYLLSFSFLILIIFSKVHFDKRESNGKRLAN